MENLPLPETNEVAPETGWLEDFLVSFWGAKGLFFRGKLAFFFEGVSPASWVVDFSIPPDSVPCVAKRLPKAPFGWNRSLPRQRHVLPARVLSCHKLPPLPPEKETWTKGRTRATRCVCVCVFLCFGGLGRGKRSKKRWVKKSGFTC